MKAFYEKEILFESYNSSGGAICSGRSFNFWLSRDNVPCQKLVERPHGTLIGLYQYYFADEEDANEFSQINIDLVDEHMEELAMQLGATPEKVISHVLEYQACVDRVG